MARALDGVVGGGFGPPQWLALLGAALLAVWAFSLTVFLCGARGGSSTGKGGGGKASAPAQEMAARCAPAAATMTRISCEEAPTLEIASRSAAAASTATRGSGDPERSRRRCRCAGCPQCGPCGPCDSGFGAEGGDFCCCCGGCDCDCGCGGCDCSGVDCIGVCCGACLMLLTSC